MEEIGDLDSDKSKLFKEALANEKEQDSTRKQKINMKKVTFRCREFLIIFNVNTEGYVYFLVTILLLRLL